MASSCTGPNTICHIHWKIILFSVPDRVDSVFSLVIINNQRERLYYTQRVICLPCPRWTSVCICLILIVSSVILGHPVGWTCTFLSTSARKKKKIICLFPTQIYIHNWLLFLFWVCCFYSPVSSVVTSKELSPRGPLRFALSLGLTHFLTPFTGSRAKFPGSSAAALWTQFAHTECCRILFAAGRFFWTVHFPGMAVIAFSDLSRDVDYFAFVSHLYGKGLQVWSVLWPLIQLEKCQGHVHGKVKNAWPMWHFE